MIRHRIFYFFLLLVSCVSRPEKLPEPDINIFKEWSAGAQKEEPFETPFVSNFDLGKFKLTYVAADHSAGLESSTFKTVSDVFNSIQPKIVIVEGFPISMGLSPKFIVDDSLACANDSFKNCMEPIYVAYLAHKSGVPFIGGEPDEEFIVNGVLNVGYTAEDLMGYYIVRMIPQWKQEGKLTSSNLKKLVSEEIKFYKNKIPVKTDYSYANFKSWFEKVTRLKLAVASVKNSMIAPGNNEGASVINKLAALTSKLRDQHIVKLIHSSLNEYKNVMIVYGSGHLVMQRPTLEKMLGPSKDQKLH